MVGPLLWAFGYRFFFSPEAGTGVSRHLNDRHLPKSIPSHTVDPSNRGLVSMPRMSDGQISSWLCNTEFEVQRRLAREPLYFYIVGLRFDMHDQETESGNPNLCLQQAGSFQLKKANENSVQSVERYIREAW
jgi:hypothetical protein